MSLHDNIKLVSHAEAIGMKIMVQDRHQGLADADKFRDLMMEANSAEPYVAAHYDAATVLMRRVLRQMFSEETAVLVEEMVYDSLESVSHVVAYIVSERLGA